MRARRRGHARNPGYPAPVSVEAPLEERRRGGRAIVGVLVLVVGALAVCGGLGVGFVRLAGFEPPHPVWGERGAPGAPIALRFTGGPRTSYDLALDFSVEATKTRPAGAGARYLHGFEVETTLTRGTPAHALGRFDTPEVEAPVAGIASGSLHLTGVETDGSGAIEGAVVVRPTTASHGLTAAGVSLSPSSDILLYLLVLAGAVVLGVVGCVVGGVLIVGAVRRPRVGDTPSRV